MYNLLYDGTFAGFLSALNRKLHQPALELCIKPVNGFEQDLYSNDFALTTDISLARKMLSLLKVHFSAEEIRHIKGILKQAAPGCEYFLCHYILNRLQQSAASSNEDKNNAAAA